MIKQPPISRFCNKFNRSSAGILSLSFHYSLFYGSFAFNAYSKVIGLSYKNGLHILLSNNGDLDWIVIT